MSHVFFLFAARKWAVLGFFIAALMIFWRVPPAKAGDLCRFNQSVSTAWETPQNWDCGHVPAAGDDVVILQNKTALLSSAGVGATLSIGTGSQLRVKAGYSLTISGNADNNGLLDMMPAGGGADVVVQGAFNNLANGQITLNDGKLQINGDLTNNGSLDNGTGRLTLQGGWLVLGTFIPGTGMVRFNGGASQTIPAGTYYNIQVDKVSTGQLTSGGVVIANHLTLVNGVFSIGDNSLRLTGDLTSSGGTLDMNNGAVDMMGTAAQNINGLGAIKNIILRNSQGGVYFYGSQPLTLTGTVAFIENAKVNVVANVTVSQSITSLGNLTVDLLGTLTVNGDLTVQGSLQNAGGLSLGGNFTIDGPMYSGDGAVNFIGSGNQQVNGLGIGLGRISLTQQAGGTVSFNNDVLILGNVVINSGGLKGGTKTIEIRGNVSASGGSFDPQTGTLKFSGSQAQELSTALPIYNLTVEKAAGSVFTLASGGNLNVANKLTLVSGILNAGATTLQFTAGGTPFSYQGGTFQPGTGTVTFAPNGSDITLAAVSYNNLNLIGDVANRKMTVNGSTSVSNILSLNANAVLEIGAHTFTANGDIQNNGKVTIGAGGKYVHAAESAAFTDASGTAYSSYTAPGSVYATIKDASRNLNGATVETFTLTVAANADAGGDTETLTLAETGAATGIFRNASSLAFVTSTNVSAGNQKLEAKQNGQASFSYVDPYDPSDAKSATVTLNAAFAGQTPPPQQQQQNQSQSQQQPQQPGSTTTTQMSAETKELLNKLQQLGVSVHALVKLADDGNAATQSDSAVYYVGGDGRRHAFSNEKVYFTWYCDFVNVQVISSSVLASIPLGKNVTYRPALKMVKFLTDPKVYAISQDGKLRHVTSESLATALYGSTWNKQIDDISDAFYTDYVFGTPLNSISELNVTFVKQAVFYPSDIMAITGHVATEGQHVFSCPVVSDGKKDTDSDGLSDEQEKQFKTDPTKSDTDADGLSDGMETQIYKTDPLKKDTDGDGYSDYAEIVTGYNPLGPGKKV